MTKYKEKTFNKLMIDSAAQHHGVVDEAYIIKQFGIADWTWRRWKAEHPEIEQAIDAWNDETNRMAKKKVKDWASEHMDDILNAIDKNLQGDEVTETSIRKEEGTSAKQGTYTKQTTHINKKKVLPSLKAAELGLRAMGALDDNINVKLSSPNDDKTTDELAAKAKELVNKLLLTEDGEDD